MLVEEDPTDSLLDVDDSGWCNDDCVTDRHLKGGSDKGWGNLGFLDGHVGRVKLPPRVSSPQDHFTANDMCFRVGHKWVSGRSWVSSGMYGLMDAVPDAGGVRH